MLLIAHQTQEDANTAAIELRQLGKGARGLLEQCVASQGVTRKAMSQAASLLSAAGFVFIRDSGDIWSPQITLLPTLAGEEALEALEQIEEDDPSTQGRANNNQNTEEQSD